MYVYRRLWLILGLCVSPPKRLYFSSFNFWGCPCSVAKVTWRILEALLGFQISIKSKDITTLYACRHRWRSYKCAACARMHCIYAHSFQCERVCANGLHMWINACVFVCSFPDVFHLEIKRASSLTPALSLKTLIGLESLEHGSLSMIVLLFSSLFCFLSALWLCRLAGRQKGTGSPIVQAQGTQLWAKSVQNVKHRWPLTHKWVHGKWESLLCQTLLSLPWSTRLFAFHSSGSSVSPAILHTPSLLSFFFFLLFYTLLSHMLS